MAKLSRPAAIALMSSFAAFGPPACRRPEPPLSPGFDIRTLASRELLREANRGREILGPDGRFVLPERVGTVWIDVGAHMLETTGPELQRDPGLAVVAIEPLAECWRTWPDNERLIALPVAIDLERGMLDFHVNANNATSSLAESVEEGPYRELTRTVEVRKVPVLRLDDVLERISARLDIDWLKTDVQGFDLRVLQSGGSQLGRVRRVKAEVINAAIYKGAGASRPGLEQEVVDYMRSQGFRFLRDSARPDRSWVDKDFVNPARMTLLVRVREHFRLTPR